MNPVSRARYRCVDVEIPLVPDDPGQGSGACDQATGMIDEAMAWFEAEPRTIGSPIVKARVEAGIGHLAA